MIAANAGANNAGDGGRGGRGSKRPDALGKLAASAFISAKKKDSDEDSDGSENIMDQRLINEIFVRLKVAEISSLNFAALGILCGIFDYEISYNDLPDNDKYTRIVLESF